MQRAGLARAGSVVLSFDSFMEAFSFGPSGHSFNWTITGIRNFPSGMS